MASSRKYVIPALLTFLVFLNYVDGNLYQGKYEVNYSFHRPFFIHLNRSIPNWHYGGDAALKADALHLTPYEEDKKGAAWAKFPTNFRWWEVNMMIHIYGKYGRLGGDGLAFWYTKDKGQFNGTVYGSSDHWVGLGVFIDTFDNDHKHDNPIVIAMTNDGTREFDHANDGSDQHFGSCYNPLLSTGLPIHLKIRYFMNDLTILFHGDEDNFDEYKTVCLKKKNLYLPDFGYFGVSAATGSVADSHEVYHFLTVSLTQRTTEKDSGFNETFEEPERFFPQFQKNQRKSADFRQEQGQIERPELKEDLNEFYRWFDFYNQRELRRISSYQVEMLEEIRELNKNLNETIGCTESSVNVESQQPVSSTFGEKFNKTISMENATLPNKIWLTAINELRSLAIEINSRADKILQNQMQQSTVSITSFNYDVNVIMKEVRDLLTTVQAAISGLKQFSANDNTYSSCIGVTTFLISFAIQLLLIVCYTTYRERQVERTRKLF